MALATLALAGCGGGSDATTPAPRAVSPATSTPATTPSPSVRASSDDDLGLTGVEACDLLTPATLTAAGLSGATASPGLPPDGASDTCTAALGTTAATFAVSLFPSTSLDAWQASHPSATTVTVADFPGAAAPSTDQDDPVRCRVAVGTTPTDTLQIDRYATATLTADRDACPEASTTAAAVVAALQATR